MMISRTLIAAAVLLFVSCSGVYYGAMEKLGYAKRDLMVSRVKAAQKSQQQAKQEFRSALDRFKSVVNLPGSRLEDKYSELKKELERCEAKADDVHQRIAAVADVSEALFDEWKSELKQYRNQALRRASERKLDQTKARYEELMDAMRNAESRLEPVLQPLRDNVLFLKHNLNARAVASLDAELAGVQSSVDSLVADLERSIAEADRFIGEINSNWPS